MWPLDGYSANSYISPSRCGISLSAGSKRRAITVGYCTEMISTPFVSTLLLRLHPPVSRPLRKLSLLHCGSKEQHRQRFSHFGDPFPCCSSVSDGTRIPHGEYKKLFNMTITSSSIPVCDEETEI